MYLWCGKRSIRSGSGEAILPRDTVVNCKAKDGGTMKEAEEQSGADAARSGAFRRFLPLFVLIAAGAAIYLNGWHRYLSLEQIAVNRDVLQGFVSSNVVLAVLAYAAIYIGVVTLSLPGGALLTITGGFLLGWFLGGLAAVVAATAGASLLFLIARTSLGEALADRAGPWLEKLSAGFREDALSYLLFLRLVPAFPFWLVNLAPAFLGVPLATYVLGTFAGIIPGTFAFAFVGAGLDSIIEAQQAAYRDCLADHAGAAEGPCSFSLDPGSLLTPEILAAFAVLGVVALIPVVVKKVRGRTGSQAQ